ncbi:unnamed protein product [Scytosiphon promiscuus]
MFTQAPSFTFLLALALGPANVHVQGFHAVMSMVSGGRHLSCRGVPTCPSRGIVRPHATTAGVFDCACTACAAPRSVWREVLGNRPRRIILAAGAMGEEGGEVAPAAADMQGVDLTDKTVEELWMRVKKQLLSVGKGGIKPSHVRSLNSLVEAHTLVKVKINIPNADLEEVGLELAGKGGLALQAGAQGDAGASPVVGVSVVTVNSNQNMILFANTDFLKSEAKGEVFDSGKSS